MYKTKYGNCVLLIINRKPNGTVLYFNKITVQMNIFTFLLFLYTLIYDLLKDNLTVAIGGDDYRFISLLFKQD